MDLPYRPNWVYLTQYDPSPQSYDQDFQNNFYSSQSSWGFTISELDYQSPCPSSSFLHFASHTHFSKPPIEEKLELQKSLEAMLEAQKQFEIMTASSYPQNFPNPI